MEVIKSNCLNRTFKIVYGHPYYSDSTKKMSDIDTIQIFEYLIDNTFAMFGGHAFQQTFLWVKPVHLFSLTYSFIGMKQTSYWGFSIKAERS